jgi:predicted transglutaminase-like cysteine proteinase
LRSRLTESKSFFRIRLQQKIFVGARKMRRTVHTFKLVTVAASFVMSCTLPYATRANLDHPHQLKVVAERAGFDIPAAAPVEFLAFSRELNMKAERASIDMPVNTVKEFLALSQDLNAEIQWTSVSQAAAVSGPVRNPANAHQINTNMASHSNAAFHLPDRLEPNVDRISFEAPVLAPMAFMRFCIRYPQDCKVHQMAFRPAPVTLTKAREAELAKVNRDVNRAIRPQENLSGLMAEEWLVAPRAGDCNDYAVTKRHELLARGWPSRSLLLAEVVVGSGEHHLVLVVRTREDDVVLDSLSWTVRPVSQIHYQWVRAQQAGNPKFWSAINVTRAARVAINAR